MKRDGERRMCVRVERERCREWGRARERRGKSSRWRVERSLKQETGQE